jgi:hypothetical protein
MNEGERRRKKKAMIKKLNQWQEKKGNSYFSPDMSYEEIEEEYESALDDHQKSESIKLQAWWLKTVVSTIEYGSGFVDFDLSGFGDQINEDIGSYDEIFEDLYERYKGGKLHPIVSLCLKLGITAATVNIMNRTLSNAPLGFGDVIKQSPELMKMFDSAAVDAMNNTSFGPSMEPPQLKRETNKLPPQRPSEERERVQRPDLKEARGFTLREEPGIDILYKKDVMVNEFTGESKEFKDIDRVFIIFTDIDDRFKKIEFILGEKI